MQKKIFITTMLCLTWASIFAQGVCGHPKAERQLMRFAEVEIDGFFCDSVMAEYPIYTDGEHAELDAVLVKTSDGVVWYLREDKSSDGISYKKNSGKMTMTGLPTKRTQKTMSSYSRY